MGMSVGGGRGGVKSEINVTPLVDVVLVLLIIFMVVTPMMQRGQQVDLPSSQQPDREKATPQDPLILSMTSDRRLFVEAEAYADEKDFQAKLQAALRAEPDRRLLFKADQSLTHGDVLKVMRLAQGAGAKQVALAVVKPGEGASP
ncbi:biopolymer transporter ExbD [Myxococcus sp. K38C18041901]|uniref:biopolymer transporter ExbD n=1 Tax=Myxococcus guangdongensis TaxID=2906760 RepID=UPI0020A79A9D|nr:biopolymer transporter ExbD [Myxococcus guangdongensis]MCP3064751.1 biopolymer transporter ExbD [Myxococcus guangdongensis]